MAEYLKRFPEKMKKYKWQIHDEQTNDIPEKITNLASSFWTIEIFQDFGDTR